MDGETVKFRMGNVSNKNCRKN